jgi:hypothetical protein
MLPFIVAGPRSVLHISRRSIDWVKQDRNVVWQFDASCKGWVKKGIFAACRNLAENASCIKDASAGNDNDLFIDDI